MPSSPYLLSYGTDTPTSLLYVVGIKATNIITIAQREDIKVTELEEIQLLMVQKKELAQKEKELLLARPTVYPVKSSQDHKKFFMKETPLDFTEAKKKPKKKR